MPSNEVSNETLGRESVPRHPTGNRLGTLGCWRQRRDDSSA
jgi:hypothetical protein